VAQGGHGVARIEGQVCFVRHGLPGDTVRVCIKRSARQVLWAEIEEVIAPSPHRASAACAHFDRCGVCSWVHFAYPAQAEWKQRLVLDAFERIAGFTPELGWQENPDLRLGYRTRAEFHGDGKNFGFFAPDSHDIVDMESCPLCHPRMNTALAALRQLDLKGTVTVTINPEGEETLVWTRFPQRRLKHRFPLANHPKEEGGRARFFFDGVPIVNGAFSQSSLLLNRLLVKTTGEYIGKAVSVLDLYCGNGNLSLPLSNRIRVVGYDHHHEAVKAARAAGEGEYQTGDEARMRKAIQRDEWDTILLDPPRTGAKAIMPALAECHARKIVYVACDPPTLARDVKTLVEAGWQLTRATAIDLFPNTAHVETVCRFER
jgi:23S rRNA (uracil1939-C5)-methyltransferase